MDNCVLKHGVFGWMELMTTDVKAEKTFYSEINKAIYHCCKRETYPRCTAVREYDSQNQ